MEVPINAISITGYRTRMGNDGIGRTKIKPAVPTRLFDNEDAALKWLKNYL